MELVRLQGVGGLPPGESLVVEVSGRAIAIFNVEGELLAIDNACPHRGGPLASGEICGEIVTCPWHGWQMDIRTGACVNGPLARVATHRVLVDGADLLLVVRRQPERAPAIRQESTAEPDRKTI